VLYIHENGLAGTGATLFQQYTRKTVIPNNGRHNSGAVAFICLRRLELTRGFGGVPFFHKLDRSPGSNGTEESRLFARIIRNLL
jgi:hypothetical protein